MQRYLLALIPLCPFPQALATNILVSRALAVEANALEEVISFLSDWLNVILGGQG